MKIIIASVLVLPLILAAVIPVAAPHDGYHAVVKFQTVAIPPGERVDDEFGTAPRSWLAKSPHSNQPGNTISFFGYSEIGSYRNTFQLFYSLIPIRKWTGVFVI